MKQSRPRFSPTWPWVVLAALLLQWPLVLNPGYFSHDELQWAAFANGDLLAPWRDVSAFQYRPLTFSLWMLLSRQLFDVPMAFHALLVTWGSMNAGLLFSVTRRFGLAAWPAAGGALIFAAGPFAALVHGWVGCIADLLWLSCALCAVWVAQQPSRPVVAALAAAALTSAALLAKEAALAIPPLLLVASFFDARRARWLTAAAGAGAVAAIWLTLRLDLLLEAPREGGQYVLQATNLPLRWLEYQLFAPLVPVQETFLTLRRPTPALVAGLLWLWLVVALLRTDRRLALLFLLGGAAALLPVLPLSGSWNHYGYGFAAVTAMTVAAAWPLAHRVDRVAIALFAGMTLLHGLAVIQGIRTVGEVQSRFSPALATAVRLHEGSTPLLLHPDPDANVWIFHRLTNDIPRYDGVPIGERVQLVEANAPADYRILADGRLVRLR